MVLVVPLNLSGGGVESNGRTCVKIVTRPTVTHPWPAITGSPEGEIGFRVVGACYPHGSAAGLPLVAIGPRVAARLVGRRHRVSLPDQFSGFGTECRDKAAYAKFAT